MMQSSPGRAGALAALLVLFILERSVAAEPDAFPAFDDIRGQVVSADDRRVVVDLGRVDGLYPGLGMTVELLPAEGRGGDSQPLAVASVGTADATLDLPAGRPRPSPGDPVRFLRPRPVARRSAPVNALIGRLVTLRLAGDGPREVLDRTRVVRVLTVKAADDFAIASFTALADDKPAQASNLESYSTAKVAALRLGPTEFVADPASGHLVERDAARARGVPPLRFVDPIARPAAIPLDVHRKGFTLAGIGAGQPIWVNGRLVADVANGESKRVWIPSSDKGVYRIQVGSLFAEGVVHEFRDVPPGTLLALTTSRDPGRYPREHAIESATTTPMSQGRLVIEGDTRVPVVVQVNGRLAIIEPGDQFETRGWGEPRRPVRFEVLLGGGLPLRRVVFAWDDVATIEAGANRPIDDRERTRRSVAYLRQLRLAAAHHLGSSAVTAGFPVEAMALDVNALPTGGVMPEVVAHRDVYIRYVRGIEAIRRTGNATLVFDGVKGVLEGAMDSLVMGSGGGEAAVEGVFNLVYALFGSNARLNQALAGWEKELRTSETKVMQTLRAAVQAQPGLNDDPMVKAVLGPGS